MNLKSFLDREFSEHETVLQATAASLADPLLIVPSDSTPRIQEMHIFLGHMLCDVLEQRCGK